jgi:hypothetical protein
MRADISRGIGEGTRERLQCSAIPVKMSVHSKPNHGTFNTLQAGHAAKILITAAVTAAKSNMTTVVIGMKTLLTTAVS